MVVTVATIAALFGGTSSNAEEIRPGNSKDETEIRAVMAAQVSAWNRGDIDGFMNGYARSPATEFVSGDRLTHGWQTVRDRYQKKYDSREKMGTLTFSELKMTRLSSDAALLIGRWKLARKEDKPHGRFTLLFRRTSDGWRIVHDHTSAAEPRGALKGPSVAELQRRTSAYSTLQLLQQFPVNSVEAAVAENHHYVRRL
jgi:ketosteroid isomerase-like protein